MKVLSAKTTGFRSRCQGQWMTYSQRITKLPRLVAQILFSNEIFGKVPTFVITRENQFAFNLAFLFHPGSGIGLGMFFLRSKSYYFPESFVGGIDIRELKIEHGIDPMFASQEAKTVFPTEASEKGAVVSSCLTIEIELRCPPTFDTVLKFCPGTHKRVSRFREAKDWIDGNFKVPWFFHVMVIGDKVWPLSRIKRKRQ